MSISYKDLGPSQIGILYDAFSFISNSLSEHPQAFGHFIKDHVAILADQLGCKLVDGRGLVNSEVVKTNSLEKDLSTILNCHSEENKSDTPDFILAQYLMASLDVYNKVTKERDRWKGYGYYH